jgi:hypothetical protein
MPTLTLSFDVRAPPHPEGTVVRVSRSRRLGRVLAHGQRSPEPSARYYVVGHGEQPGTPYWDHEIMPVIGETFQDVLRRMGTPIQGVNAGWRGAPEDAFRQFREENWDGLMARGVGGSAALAAAYLNAAQLHDMLPNVAEQLLRNNPSVALSDDLNHGSALALAAAQMVNASLLAHLRKANWYEHATLLMLRSALEMAGSAAVFAVGPLHARQSWLAGHRLSGELAMPCLTNLIRATRAEVPDAGAVYAWLSKHVHFTRACIADGAPAHEDAYAALAYVAWCTAIVAEAHLGVGGIAIWPKEWPERLPWDRELSAT